jgi:hypothetical protein
MQQASTETSAREAEVTADLTYRISPAWKIDVYGVKRFINGSPAVAGGIIPHLAASFLIRLRRDPPATGGLSRRLSDLGGDGCAGAARRLRPRARRASAPKWMRKDVAPSRNLVELFQSARRQ